MWELLTMRPPYIEYEGMWRNVYEFRLLVVRYSTKTTWRALTFLTEQGTAPSSSLRCTSGLTRLCYNHGAGVAQQP